MLKAEDISAEKIKSGIGGYKKTDTKEYIDTLRNEYETLTKENIELKDKLSILSEGVQYYKNMEKSLQKALVLAEKTTSETMQAAEAKADALEKQAQSRADVLIKEAKMRADSYEKEAAIKADNLIRDAKQKADDAIASGNEELRKIHSQIMSLIQQYEQYKAQYKQLAMAQMQVIESDAYNLDAPILQSISSSLENVVSIKKELSNSTKDTTDNSSEIMEEVKTSSHSDNLEKEKKVYVDARGEVVEVHEFREVNKSDLDSKNDPWKMESEEDTLDDFGDLSKEYEGPHSFSQDLDTSIESVPKKDTDTISPPQSSTQQDIDKIPESKPLENFDSEQISGIQTPVKFDSEQVSDSQTPVKFDMDQVSSSQTPVNLDTDKVFESKPSMEQDGVAMSNSIPEKISKDVSLDSYRNDGSADPSTTEIGVQEFESVSNIDSEKKIVNRNGSISSEEMKRIEKMQLERLKAQEEQQLAKLKSERYHNFSDTPVHSEEQAPKKEQDHADIFRALHKNDDSAPSVTLKDLKHQQELENSSVELPKATEQSITEQQQKKDIMPKSVTSAPMDDFLSFEPLDMTQQKDKSVNETTSPTSGLKKTNSAKNDFFHQITEQSANSFHVASSAEEGNSLDFEMDNNQGVFNTERKDTPKFKSFRDFESEL